MRGCFSRTYVKVRLCPCGVLGDWCIFVFTKMHQKSRSKTGRTMAFQAPVARKQRTRGEFEKGDSFGLP